MAAPLEHNRDGGYKASAEQMRIQQAAAAAAAEAFTPEAIAAEAARREKALAEEAAQWRKEGREQCIREGRPIEEQYLEPSPAQPVDDEINAPSDERDVSAGIRPSNAPRGGSRRSQAVPVGRM